jgi:sugar lactone lactonase YvrE
MAGLPDQAELYEVGAGFRFRRVVENVGMSNGLVWSVDGHLLYYIDSLARRVDAFDWDPSERSLSNRRPVFNLGEEPGIPDGMTIDQNGMLWIALWDGHAVIAVDPAEGKLVDRIELPVSQITSCCFGGADFKTLYITTAHIGLSAAQRNREPHAGDILSVRLETGGFPTPRLHSKT